MKEPYECPRCGYQTLRKSSMYKHLYLNKKVCATLKSMIELTEDIKSHVLQSRKYILDSLPKQSNQSMLNQTVNNYNMVYNFVAGLDTLDKIQKLVEYKQIHLLDFQQSIEDRYSFKAQRLKTTKCSFSLEHNDILQLIDNVSKITNDDEFEYLNIIYDNKYDRFKIYEEGDWKEFLRIIGLNKILCYLKEYYLDSYEVYLIRRYKNNDISLIQREQSLEFLKKYYQFIGVFDIEPFIKGKSNNKVMYNMDDPIHSKNHNFYDVDEFSIEDEFYPVYQKTRDNITKSEMNEIKKNVLDVLKNNSSRNIDQLNKKVTELFNMEEQFKQVIIDKQMI